jgi:cyanophycinase
MPHVFSRVLIAIGIAFLSLSTPTPQSIAHASRLSDDSRSRSALLLIGGGARPLDGLRLWSEATDGRILLVSWASEIPEETLQALRSDFLKAGISGERLFPAPLYRSGSPEFVRDAQSSVQKAQAIFFSGGDQNRLMRAIQEVPRLATEVFHRFEQGDLAIAGTSAGTAIATSLRFTGNEDLSRIHASNFEGAPGFNFLPRAIVDQHFMRRSRMNRLLSAILKHPDRVGYGIDEDTALWIPAKARTGRVLGTGSGVIRLHTRSHTRVTSGAENNPTSLVTELYPVGAELEIR